MPILLHVYITGHRSQAKLIRPVQHPAQNELCTHVLVVESGMVGAYNIEPAAWLSQTVVSEYIVATSVLSFHDAMAVS